MAIAKFFVGGHIVLDRVHVNHQRATVAWGSDGRFFGSFRNGGCLLRLHFRRLHTLSHVIVMSTNRRGLFR